MPLHVFDNFDVGQSREICEYLKENLNKADAYLSIIEIFIQKI